MELESVPGVGPKTADALAELDDPVDALVGGDVAAVAEAAQLPTGRAVRLVRNAQRAAHGDTDEFLATDRARELYRELVTELQGFAETAPGQARLATFYPSASTSRIDEVRSFVVDALETTVTEEARDALGDVDHLEPATGLRVRDRCLATASDETATTANQRVPELAVERVESARDVAELSRGYGSVVVLDAGFAGKDLPTNVTVDPDALADPTALVPERSLAFVGRNRTTIESAIDVHRAAGLEPPCQLAELESLVAAVTPDGDIADDDELDRLRRACDDLDAAVSTAESVANDRLREAIERRDVTVEGSDLLTLAEQGARVESLLDQELADELEAAAEAAVDHAADALSLDADERAAIEAVFPARARYPVERHEEAYDRLESTLERSRDRRHDELVHELAELIETHRDDIDELVARSIQYDVEQALARYADANRCTMPVFVDDGIAIDAGRPTSVPADEVEAVSYETSGVALLTGVNSGGKTTLLDLLAAVVILGHMGLPVPAVSAELQRFDRLYYHAKTQGTLDAGAFESTVQEFASLARAEENSLILVDELESITEPGASAKLVAGFLEALDEGAATAVFVTHLAEEIRDEAAIDLSIDGIVAEGLVDGELVVDRSPRKDHLARSTPELIVERLAGESPDDGFYDRLLAKFDDDD